MTRQDLLEISKPILFNTEMVCGILDDRKTATRRIAKHITEFDDKGNYFNVFRKGEWTGPVSKELFIELYAPCKMGDFLYVRETFFEVKGKFHYRADGEHLALNYLIGGREFFKWKPSIHMPKEAARLFLRVTNVRVERLQNITEQGAELEGCSSGSTEITGGPWGIDDDPDVWTAKDKFIEVWDSTIPRNDLDKYGWAANPWVWVIEFEKVEVEE